MVTFGPVVSLGRGTLGVEHLARSWVLKLAEQIESSHCHYHPETMLV